MASKVEQARIEFMDASEIYNNELQKLLLNDDALKSAQVNLDEWEHAKSEYNAAQRAFECQKKKTDICLEAMVLCAANVLESIRGRN